MNFSEIHMILSEYIEPSNKQGIIASKHILFYLFHFLVFQKISIYRNLNIKTQDFFTDRDLAGIINISAKFRLD